MELRPYLRKVNYYETDQMGIVHHSNYIRWFEEARLAYMDQIGVHYKDIEERGIIIPVVDVSCSYKVSARFDDLLEIHVFMNKFDGVRQGFQYEVRFQNNGKLAATGTSLHCFLDERSKPVNLKRRDPELYQQLLAHLATE